MNKLELRFKPVDLTTVEDNGGLRVNGYVNLTEQTSEVLHTNRGHQFVEKISKGAFSKALQRATEIDFLVEHDNERILSSTRNNSLNLVEDDKGLFMSATISPTTWGKDYYTLIKDNIIKNFSFGFIALEDEWQERNDGLLERTVYDLDLFEVSLVKNPAYTQSYVEARGLDYMTTDEVLQRGEKMSVIDKEKREITVEDKEDIKEDVVSSEEEIKRLADSFEELVQTLRDKQLLLDDESDKEEEKDEDAEELDGEDEEELEEEERALPDDVQEDEDEKDEESLKNTILGLEMKIEKVYSMLEEVLIDKNIEKDEEDEEKEEKILEEQEEKKQEKKEKNEEKKEDPENLKKLKEKIANLDKYE